MNKKVIFLNMINKLKKSLLWYYFIKLFVFPIYDFLWKNLINIKGRLLYFLWFRKERDYIDLKPSDGVIKVDNSAAFKKISNEVLRGCNESIISKAEEQINSFTNDNYNQSNNKENKYMADIYDYLDVDVKKKIIDFASSELMISTAAKYLGVFPILSKIIVDYKIPKNYDHKRGAMMFHKDEFGYKSLDIFMAINDIDENTGPLKTIKTKFDNLGPFSKIVEIKKDFTPGNRGKIRDETILKNNNINNEVITIEGKSGTAVLIDSFKYYHAGGHCKSKKRIVMRILYSTIDAIAIPDIKKFKKTILFDEYLKNIIKKDKFKNFFYLNRSILFENKKLSKFLYNLYRILSFKF